MAQRMRAQRQVLGVERRTAGKHPEAIPHQLQCQAVARIAARRDAAEHRAFVHLHVLDQAQALRGQCQFLQPARHARCAQGRKGRLEAPRELIREARLGAAQLADGFEQRRLHVVVARVFRLPAQLQPGFLQYDLQLPVEVGVGGLQLVFQRTPYPPRQRHRGQRLRCG